MEGREGICWMQPQPNCLKGGILTRRKPAFFHCFALRMPAARRESLRLAYSRFFSREWAGSTWEICSCGLPRAQSAHQLIPFHWAHYSACLMHTCEPHLGSPWSPGMRKLNWIKELRGSKWNREWKRTKNNMNSLHMIKIVDSLNKNNVPTKERRKNKSRRHSVWKW